jgi:hypothetical protein
MYSPVSHIAVDGAMVKKYRRNTTSDAIPAARYDGLYASSAAVLLRVAADLDVVVDVSARPRPGVGRVFAAVIAWWTGEWNGWNEVSPCDLECIEQQGVETVSVGYLQ